jgi:hypothetical protein
MSGAGINTAEGVRAAGPLPATPAPPRQVRFPGRFAVALAAAFDRDAAQLSRAFRDMSVDGADALGLELLVGLEEAARLSDDWRAWAFACNRIPWSHLRAAAAELGERIDAWAAPANRRRRSTPRRRLAGLALRLLRGGIGGRDLLRQLDAANATFDPPLAADAVGEVAAWAAGEVRGHRHG